MVHKPDMSITSVLQDAEYISREFGSQAVTSEALLFVLCTESLQTVEIIEGFGDGTCKRLVNIILNDAGINPKDLTPMRKKKLYPDELDAYEELLDEMLSPILGAVQNAQTQTKQTQTAKPTSQSKLPAEILTLGADLTQKAREGKIDNIIGRDEETQRCIEILCRKTKNNPVLIGEAGVGKSAIVEGLAKRIVADNVPDLLKNKTIFSLDIGSLMAGTKFRGELEQRLENLVQLVTKRNDIILFIDELHQITTATGKDGEIGISEMLKPRLARGEMQTIGATTTEEYRKFIERDAALERRFQPIIVNPPTTTQAIEILRGVKSNYEKFHNLTIGDDAIIAAVTLSDRYITDRNLPDKAFDCMDEACARLRVSKQKDATPYISAADIADVVSRATGIPVSKMTGDERANLAELEKNMQKFIIGQDKALSFIARAVRRSRAGVGDANRPVGSFMFLGRTGVGKTEVCKVLAKQLFPNNEKALIKLDMSEYTESHSVSKLIGSPPGYVGFDDASVVCERVRRNPYCIVLFDEIEKAHPDVYNVLLQILDEGRLTDNHGKTTSFRNAIIIMTSNAGVENLSKTAQIGFSTVDVSKGEEEQIMSGLKKRFRPEFINRIDNIVVFNSLTHEDVLKIAHLQMNALVKKMENIGLGLKIDNDVTEWLVKKYFNAEYGARPIRRAVQTEMEDPIAENIMSAEKPTSCHVVLGNDKPQFKFK
jgi:ATP-dependent Clp protease ATP-binding subunit ClpC